MGILTQPLWPAYVDAKVRGDYGWIRSMASRTLRILLLTAISLAGILVLAFPIVREHLQPASFGLVVLLALYLIANTWTHYHYVSLMGLGNVWQLSYIAVAEN